MTTTTTNQIERSFFNKNKSAHRLSNIGDVNEDLTHIASEIVPFLPKLADVVALYSCASPLRDATAASMLEHLAEQHWNNGRLVNVNKNNNDSDNNTNNNDNMITTNFDDYSVHKERTQEDEELDEKLRAISTTDMIRHILLFGTGSATSCTKIKTVDISIPLFMNNNNNITPNDTNVITDDEFINIAKYCHNLETLIADGNNSGNITEAGLHYAATCLARNENFKKISLKAIPLRDLKGLALVKSLESVDCSLNEKLTPDGLAPLSQLRNLKEVLLVRCPLLGSVDGLADSPSISRLDISACPVSSIEKLANNLKTLKWLKADATRIENGLAPLQFSSSLEWISIRDVRANEEELCTLAKISSLKHVCIYNARIETVDFLEDFSNIESLDIGMLQVKRADFRDPSMVPQLSRLAMRYCPVVETIYMQKQWGRTLKFLDLLNASQLSDDGLQTLGEGVPNLTSLNLAGTMISDITVENEISKLSQLEFLDLSNTAVTSVNCLTMTPGGNNNTEYQQREREQEQKEEEELFIDRNGEKSPGCPKLKTLKLECCRNFPGYRRGGGLKGLGNLKFLTELHIGCTNARDFSKTPIFEQWPSLKILDCSGLLRPPKEFLTFCLACTKLQKIVLTNADLENTWREVADAITSQRYIEIQV